MKEQIRTEFEAWVATTNGNYDYFDCYAQGYQAALSAVPAQEPCITCNGIGVVSTYGHLTTCGDCLGSKLEPTQQPAQEPVKPAGFITAKTVEWLNSIGEMIDAKIELTFRTEPSVESYTIPFYLAPHEPVKQENWLPIETAPKGKKIIVKYKNAYGNERTAFAKYIERFTEEPTCECECDEYDEKTDTYYLKEGWVELVENWDEFSSVYFDSANIPTGWMPAPLVEAQP